VARLFEPPVQRAPVDAEDACGVRLVAADRVEYLPHVATLHLIERDQLAWRLGRDHDLAALMLLDLCRQIVDGDLVEPAQRDRTLHAVLELADVARPVIIHEQARGRPRDALYGLRGASRDPLEEVLGE